ncbi:MAG: hypothetical protein K6E92_01415 [Lachnospiraceae bacterium]|nr:hypothetical protein [Lachnospiraceae bacterium]
MEKTVKMIACSTCGAEYDASLIRCPYCGTGHAPAEEDEYMGKLEGIRTDLEGHREDGSRRLKKGFGRMLCAALVAVALIAALILGVLQLSGNREKEKARQQKEEFLQSQGIQTQQEDTGR